MRQHNNTGSELPLRCVLLTAYQHAFAPNLQWGNIWKLWHCWLTQKHKWARGEDTPLWFVMWQSVFFFCFYFNQIWNIHCSISSLFFFFCCCFLQKHIFSHVINLGVSKWSPRSNCVMRNSQISIYPAKACCNHWMSWIVCLFYFYSSTFIRSIKSFLPNCEVSLRVIYCQKLFWGSRRFWRKIFISLLFEIGKVQAWCIHSPVPMWEQMTLSGNEDFGSRSWLSRPISCYTDWGCWPPSRFVSRLRPTDFLQSEWNDKNSGSFWVSIILVECWLTWLYHQICFLFFGRSKVNQMFVLLFLLQHTGQTSTSSVLFCILKTTINTHTKWNLIWNHICMASVMQTLANSKTTALSKQHRLGAFEANQL